MLVTLGQGTQRGMSVQLSRSRARDLEKGDFFIMSCENEAFELCRGRRSIATLGRDSNEPGLRMLKVRPGLAVQNADCWSHPLFPNSHESKKGPSKTSSLYKIHDCWGNDVEPSIAMALWRQDERIDFDRCWCVGTNGIDRSPEQHLFKSTVIMSLFVAL